MAFNQPSYFSSAYGNPYVNNFGQNVQMPQMQPINQPQILQPQINQAPMLYGKVVDGIDVVKATDVPLSQTGIFPKADLSEVFLKGWSNDGTTFVKAYKEVVESSDEEDKPNPYDEKLNQICDAIAKLSQKVDKMKSSSTTTTRKKKIVEEVDEDDE